jgi:hypothetical protein
MLRLDLPKIAGGDDAEGYLVELHLRPSPSSAHEVLERSYTELVSAQSPRRVTVEAMEVPRAVELCAHVIARDLARHTVEAQPVCVGAETIAAAIRQSSDPVADAQPPSSPQAMQAGTSAPPPFTAAGSPAMSKDDAARHVESCSVSAPGAAPAAWPSSLALALPLLARRPRR